jgi:hypothetical protein
MQNINEVKQFLDFEMSPASDQRNLRSVFNQKIRNLTKNNQLTWQGKKQTQQVDIMLFGSGQIFGEERHI